MEKGDVVKMAQEIVKTLLETKQLKLRDKDSTKDILDKLKSLAKGIIEIEKKL